MLMTDLVGSVNQTGHPFVVRKDWIWNATQYPENLAGIRPCNHSVRIPIHPLRALIICDTVVVNTIS